MLDPAELTMCRGQPLQVINTEVGPGRQGRMWV